MRVTGHRNRSQGRGAERAAPDGPPACTWSGEQVLPWSPPPHPSVTSGRSLFCSQILCEPGTAGKGAELPPLWGFLMAWRPGSRSERLESGKPGSWGCQSSVCRWAHRSGPAQIYGEEAKPPTSQWERGSKNLQASFVRYSGTGQVRRQCPCLQRTLTMSTSGPHPTYDCPLSWILFSDPKPPSLDVAHCPRDSSPILCSLTITPPVPAGTSSGTSRTFPLPGGFLHPHIPAHPDLMTPEVNPSSHPLPQILSLFHVSSFPGSAPN